MTYRTIKLTETTTVKQVQSQLATIEELINLSPFFQEWHGREVPKLDILTNNQRVRRYKEENKNHHLMMTDYIQLKQFDNKLYQKLLDGKGIQFVSQNMLFTIKSGKTRRHSKVLQIDNFGTHRKKLFKTITVPMNAKGIKTLEANGIRREYQRVFKNFA